MTEIRQINKKIIQIMVILINGEKYISEVEDI